MLSHTSYHPLHAPIIIHHTPPLIVHHSTYTTHRPWPITDPGLHRPEPEPEPANSDRNPNPNQVLLSVDDEAREE